MWKAFVLRAAPLFLVYFTREKPGIVFLENVQFFLFLVNILMKKKVNKILAAFEINVGSQNPFRFVVLYDIYKTVNSNAANQSLVKYAYVTYVMKAKYGKVWT